jgi:hypothetical protein
MPYIKKEQRPEFDEVVRMFQDLSNLDVVTVADYVVSLYDKYPSDGCLNYLFTQLIRKNKGNSTVTSFIYLIIDKIIFKDGERYKNYQRVGGLLYRMKKEFKRRGWVDTAHVIESLMGALDNLCNAYEDIKIKENGDVE